MAQSSYYGQLVRMRESAFAEDEPVSATQAFTLRSNLLHLADSFCQTRINWCAGINSETGNSVLGGFGDFWGSTPPAVYEQEFQLTWLATDHPANLDFLIRSAIIAGGTEEMDVRVRVVPAYVGVADMGAPAIVDETHQVTNTTGLWEHQAFFDNTDTSIMGLLRGAVFPGGLQIAEDDEWHAPEVSLLKLQIQLIPTSGSAPFYMMLTGVQVREFP